MVVWTHPSIHLLPSCLDQISVVVELSIGQHLFRLKDSFVENGRGRENFLSSRVTSSKKPWIGYVSVWALMRSTSATIMGIRSCWRERGSLGMRQRLCRRIPATLSTIVDTARLAARAVRSKGQPSVGCPMQRGPAPNLLRDLKLRTCCLRRRKGRRRLLVSRVCGHREIRMAVLMGRLN